METKITDAITTAIKTGIKISANYDHIELTEEETNAAIYAAKKFKDAKIREAEYRKKIFEKPVYQKWGFEELDRNVRIKHNVCDIENSELIEKLKSQKIEPYILDDHNRDEYTALCQYFSGDESFESEGMSLKKGLLLFGPVGCGKTSLMRMFSINSFRPYSVIACKRIANEYQENGANSVYTYSQMAPIAPHMNFGHTQEGKCFDDLGTEAIKKNFGNEMNVMQDIISDIYDNGLLGLFHLTTNLSSAELDERYGYRVRSRLREMFNIVNFGKNAPDRRK